MVESAFNATKDEKQEYAQIEEEAIQSTESPPKFPSSRSWMHDDL
jgi:hypothetical protein